MKNAHGVEPIRYMKKENCKEAIDCHSGCGPIFGHSYSWVTEIYINDNCNRENSCVIENNDRRGYNCHPQYK